MKNYTAPILETLNHIICADEIIVDIIENVDTEPADKWMSDLNTAHRVLLDLMDDTYQSVRPIIRPVSTEQKD